MTDGERWTMDTADGRWTMDDGRWTMDDGGPQLQLTTQQSNSAWETEDGGSDERQRILQLIRRDYDWEKEEGLHLPCKSEGGMPRRPL